MIFSLKISPLWTQNTNTNRFQCLYFVWHSRAQSVVLFSFSFRLKRDSALYKQNTQYEQSQYFSIVAINNFQPRYPDWQQQWGWFGWYPVHIMITNVWRFQCLSVQILLSIIVAINSPHSMAVYLYPRLRYPLLLLGLPINLFHIHCS